MSSANDVTEIISSGERIKLASILKISNPESLQKKRVRVDQFRLKKLLNDNESESFIRKLEASTRTVISLPETNIDVRTRKSVYMKIVGLPEDIREAEAEVTRALGTSENAVTIKLNVSHTSHSHIIGKDGSNVKKIRQETRCNVHLPDSNLKNDHEKNNHVFISGHVDDVENARIQLRDLSPLVMTFRLPGETIQMDLNSPRIAKIKQDYGVMVNFRVYTKFPSTMVIVSAPSWRADKVKAATKVLIKEMSHLSHIKPIQVQTTMEVSPQYHSAILGPGGSNVEDIMWSTNTAIVAFRDGGNPNMSASKRNNVTVIGYVDEIYQARQKLLECLPLTLIFHLPEGHSHFEEDVCRVMQDLDVYINVQPKQSSVMVSIEGVEGNPDNVYEARRRLLGLQVEPRPHSRSTPTNIPVDSEDSSPRSISDNSSPPNVSPKNDAMRPFELWTGFEFDRMIVPGRRFSNYWNDEDIRSFSNAVPRVSTDCIDLPSLLIGAGLEKYIDLFAREAIDIGVFLTLQERDLEQIGVFSWETRRKFLLLIVQLKKFLAGRRVSTHESRKSLHDEECSFQYALQPPLAPCCSDDATGGKQWVPYSKSAIFETETSSSDFSPLKNLFLGPCEPTYSAFESF